MPDLVDVKSKDALYFKLAREIAVDLHDIQTILKNNEINQAEWEVIQRDARFRQILTAAVEAWNRADNTPERVKLKSGVLIEEWLLEANTRIHDKTEGLTAKTEVVKVLARLAGMGERATADAGTGQRFSVTINLGGGGTFAKEVTPKVTTIEHQEAD